MAAILLIHGTCHGARCWREVVPLPTGAGRTARAIEAPDMQVGHSPRDDVRHPACPHSPFFADPKGLSDHICRIASGNLN